MAFGVATVLTNVGKATLVNRLLTTPTRNPPKFIGIGTGATAAARTAAAADVALSTEVETRASGTESITTTTVTNDTYQTVGTITATAGRNVDEIGTFDASSAGNMSVSATVAPIGLSAADSLQVTAKTQGT